MHCLKAWARGGQPTSRDPARTHNAGMTRLISWLARPVIRSFVSRTPHRDRPRSDLVPVGMLSRRLGLMGLSRTLTLAAGVSVTGRRPTVAAQPAPSSRTLEDAPTGPRSERRLGRAGRQPAAGLGASAALRAPSTTRSR